MLPTITAVAALAATSYTLFNPAPDDKLRDLCTDRPTKSTSPCTLDAGHFQLESDIFNETLDHTGAVSTTTQLLTGPTLKLGLTDLLDAEISITPYERVVVRGHGTESTAGGFGDTYLKLKWNVLGNASDAVGFALVPYVKAPTGSARVGNRATEGGVIAPVSFTFPDSWSLVIDPELDSLANSSGGGGHHLNAAGVLSLSKGLSHHFTASAELWSDRDWDAAGRVTLLSADLGAAWSPESSPNLQFDGGFNFGLNHQTPGVQGYLGISQRF